MEGPNAGQEGSWLARGIYLAPIIFTIAYAHRRTLSRMWGSEEQEVVDEKGRPIPAPPPAVAAMAPPPLPSPPPRHRSVEDKEQDADEGEEIHIIQQTIVRMARAGDVEGLTALLTLIEEKERKKIAELREHLEREVGEIDNLIHASSALHLNFIFGEQRPISLPSHERKGRTEGGEAYTESEHDAEEGCTPLFVAALHGHGQIVQLLIDRGADPNLRSTRDRVHPLYVACLEGHADVVRALLASVDVDTVGVESDGSTPLMGCCEGGHVGPARLLLDRGANVDAPARSGATALFFATQQGHGHLVRLLALGHRCDVNACKDDGSTALFLAIVSGRVDIVRVLLAAGADVHVRSKNGDTPLAIAAKLRPYFPAIYDEIAEHARLGSAAVTHH